MIHTERNAVHDASPRVLRSLHRTWLCLRVERPHSVPERLGVWAPAKVASEAPTGRMEIMLEGVDS